MSAALNARDSRDTSIQSAGTHPDLSLGSFSNLSTPIRPKSGLRVPSTTSQTTAQSSAPISTPSSGATFNKRRNTIGQEDVSHSMSRKMTSMSYDEELENGGDILDTPGNERPKWGDDAETPLPRSKRGARAGAGAINLTLRDQEKVRHQHLFYYNYNLRVYSI